MSVSKLLSMFLAAVLLASCGGQGEMPPASSEARPALSSAASQAKAEPLKGLSLEDMGYSIDYAAAPPELRERLERESGFQSVKYDDNWVDGIKGNYTKLFLYMNYLYGSDEVILSYLQAFPNEETGPEALVRIAEKAYSFSDLKSCLVYQDSAISVYDVFPLLDSYASVPDVIQETVDSVNNPPDDLDDWPPDRPKPPHLDAADYNGLLELEEFYQGNLSKMIAPRSPAETAGAMDRDAAFFIKDSAMHRFYIPSHVDEIVFEDEGITQCEPLSNQTLFITKYNPEYTQYAAGTGIGLFATFPAGL